MSKYQPTNRLTDKRVKKVIVFDTETAPYYEDVQEYLVKGVKEEPKAWQYTPNTLEQYEYKGHTYYKYLTTKKQRQLIFDIGWTVADKRGNIFIKRNYLVREVFINTDMMKHAHYFNKYPQYLDMLQDGKIKMRAWSYIIAKFEQDILDYGVHECFAFNISFDKRAMEETHRVLTGRKFLFWKAQELRANCLWGMSAETIMSKRGYIETAIEQGWLSSSGNITTNAECAYRYITGIYEFQESHTALDDAVIETEIMSRCFKTRIKMSFGIIEQPWKLVKAKAEALGMLQNENEEEEINKIITRYSRAH